MPSLASSPPPPINPRPESKGEVGGGGGEALNKHTLHTKRSEISPVQKFKAQVEQEKNRTFQFSTVLLMNSIPSSCRPSISITCAKACVAHVSVGISSNPYRSYEQASILGQHFENCIHPPGSHSFYFSCS